ncbi:MAG TPA: hypothetical protein VFQ68_19805 [Streptosporangiaceae bacterium]|nr:hypothetical protein [Streptosporangiaceae bacterium]
MSLLGVTGPSANQENSTRRERRARVIRLNVLYVTAFGVAAAMMTLIVFSVRQLLPSHTGIPPLAAGLLFVYLAACDMRRGPLRTPGLWRQTCPAWRLRFGIPLSTVFWRLDIGTTRPRVLPAIAAVRAARSPSSSPIPPGRCGSTGSGRTTSSCSATPARPRKP